MVRTLSTYLFIKRKLTPALLTEIARHGIEAVEIFCARAHFNYHSTDVVREIAAALRDHNLKLHALHCSRRSATSIPCTRAARRFRSAIPNACGASKRWTKSSGRSTWPNTCRFAYLVQHMGSSRDAADPRRFDAAFSSLEHLHIFAKERGVTMALENTPGELATPATFAAVRRRDAADGSADVLRHRARAYRRRRAGQPRDHARIPGDLAHSRQPRSQGRAPASLRRHH